MKKLTILCVLLCCCSPVKSTAQQEVYTEISYKAETRGSAFEIVVNQKTALIQTLSSKDSLELTAKQKLRLNSLISSVNTSSLALLKAPSEKRYSDGALSASLRIVIDGTTYISSSFDHGNPPAEIKDLVTTLTELFTS